MTSTEPTIDPGRPDEAATGPDYVDYLITKRDAVAAAVSAAISAIELPGRPRRILDAGTGAGGALPPLLSIADPDTGQVLAIDVDPRAVALAREHTDDPRADVRVGDLRKVAAAPAENAGPFDLIWASDVVWPVTFTDPGQVVAGLAGALAPGGTLALFTDNYYQSMFLPGHSRLERLIRTASELTWTIPDDGPAHYERLGAWMRQARLQDVTLRVVPLSAATSHPATRAYLERSVWPEMRHAVAANGRAAGMTADDLGCAEELLDPKGPGWIGHDPDGYVVQPTLLWTGTREEDQPHER